MVEDLPEDRLMEEDPPMDVDLLGDHLIEEYPLEDLPMVEDPL
jgi:hypothetical protein